MNYQPSTILPPEQGNSKFGGTQSRIIMGGVNAQDLNGELIPCLEYNGLQYGLYTFGSKLYALNLVDTWNVGKAYAFRSDAAYPENTVVLTAVNSDIIIDPETLEVTGDVEYISAVAGKGYWCTNVIEGDITLYTYIEATAGRDIAEVYDLVKVLAPSAMEGKQALAEAITDKGVETSVDDSLIKMAENVGEIPLEQYTIDGGEMYAKQLYGSLTTPNYWNLYEVLAQLLSDGRLVNYGGILLAEYYKVYDSLALAGAGAGGAYVVSDKDAQGNFIMYTSDTTHTWDTEDDGKGNRWVAYCFADEYHDFQITDTNTSPRSIFIGRKVGTITCMANTRTSQIVVPENNTLKCFAQSTYTSKFGSRVVITNLSEQSGRLINDSSVESVYIKAGKLTFSGGYQAGMINSTSLSSALIIADEISIIGSNASIINNASLGSLIIISHKITHSNESYNGVLWQATTCNTLKSITCYVEEMLGYPAVANNADATNILPNLTTFFFGYITNDKSKSVTLRTRSDNVIKITNIEIQEGWCKPLNVSVCSRLTEENMYAHILQRLKQDEAGCGDGVTITLGATNLAKLTSAESIALLDSLTNTYGYTFA